MNPRIAIRRRRKARGPVRRVVEAGVLLGIAGIVFGEFLVEGWPTPIVVSSGSMATTLLGPHRLVRCPACGLEFNVDAEGEPAPGAATCPNCGRTGIEPDGPIVAGDRLLVDRGTFLLRGPRRWETALFRCADHARDYCVKRIVGLPGDAVEIRDGDVFIDGAIARKPLARQREMAVIVHDTAWSAAESSLPNRWIEPTESGWEFADGAWRCSARAPSINWLSYVHWRRGQGSSPTVEESPVYDEDGYNQQTSRQLNAVTDLMLVGQLSASGGGMLLIKALDGREEFQLTIEPAKGTIDLARGGRTVQTARVAIGFLDRPTELVLSLIDQQIVLAIDGREELVYPYQPLAGPVHAPSQPFSLGDRGLNVRITRLQIWRDVYYTPTTLPSAATVCRLGADEYFVLGDNSPISRDSRPWTGGEVYRGALLVGRPLHVFRRGE